MDWISQIPTEAWGALGTVFLSFASALGLLVREGVKRREVEARLQTERLEAEAKLETERARIELEERKADTVNFTAVIAMLDRTLQELKQSNTEFVNRLDSLAKSSQTNAAAALKMAESQQVMLELTKSSSEDVSREAVRVISSTRTAHAETRAYVKEQTDPIATAIEQLRAEIPVASQHALQAAADDFLEKVYKLREETAPAEQPTGETVTDPSAAKQKDGDSMASATVPQTVKPPKNEKKGEGNAGQESKSDDGQDHRKSLQR